MSEKKILLSPPHMDGGELELVQEAFASGFVVPLGPMLDAFEAEFAEIVGIPHCLGVSSGTAAMHLALHHLGIGPGDEVLASTLTFIASVSPVTYLGGRLSFVDADRDTWNMDTELLAEAVEERVKQGRRPKAVIPTDLFGQPCDPVRIRAICEPYGIPVICDSAESLGATYSEEGDDGKRVQRHAGAGATAAVYSFNGNKIITTSSGGMLASHDKDLIAHARKLATQAREPVPHYEHREIGYNYRMSNILAAIGRGQLRVLKKRVNRRRAIFDLYKTALEDVPGIEFMPEAPYGRHNRWLTVLVFDPSEFGADTNTVREALAAANIESRPVWKPMHMQPVFQGAEVIGGGVSEDLFARGLCLPSGSAMTDDDICRVCEAIRNTHNKGGELSSHS